MTCSGVVRPKTVTSGPSGMTAKAMKAGATEIAGFFGNPDRDLSNAWISYESNQPVFVYASVLDNGSEDPTFIPASEDTGIAPPPQPQLPPPQPPAPQMFASAGAAC